MSLALRKLWAGLDGDEQALSSLRLTGRDPVLPSSFAIGTAAQASIAASTLASCEIARVRGAGDQFAKVDMLHAALEFRSERYLRINGQAPADPWDSLAGLYPTQDASWVRLHTNFAHHRAGIVRLLGCADSRASVAAALAGWRAQEFETAATEAGMVVAALRSFEQWDAHPQGRAIASLPVITLERIETGEPTARAKPMGRLNPGDPALRGLRVLDLTRVIAGPVCTRALAAHGADVLSITGAHLPTISSLQPDTGRGKRTAHLDLRLSPCRKNLRELIRHADVFVMGYRPDSFVAQKFNAKDLAHMRPGIVVGSLSAYGHVGPWANKRGFDSLVQTATGFNVAEMHESNKDMPQALPAQVLDHATGYLMAFGVQMALLRRARVGGSWHVRVSLAQTAQWLRSLGPVNEGMLAVDPNFDDAMGYTEESDSAFGRLTAIRHAGQLSDSPVQWLRRAAKLGTHSPVWGQDTWTGTTQY